MRKILKLTLFFLLLTALFSLASCNESEPPATTAIEQDGLLYDISGDGTYYELCGVKEKRESYTVASEVAGLPVRTVGRSVFFCNDMLVSIVIPEGVEVISDYAFYGCSALTSVSLPSTVREMGFNSFADCTALSAFVMPASLETLKDECFARCLSLEKLYVNPALSQIGKKAFVGCDKLSELHVESLSAWCAIDFKDFSANPISDCEKLFINGVLTEELDISGVEEIKKTAFYSFVGIKTLNIGDGVKTVGVSAFSNCENLTRVTFSDSVENVEKFAFNSCSALEYVSVGSGIKSFGGRAFYACNSLYGVEIKDLGAWCEAYFYMDTSGSSNPLRYAGMVYVNGEPLDNLVIPDGTKNIAALAFIGYEGTAVTLPKSLKTIADTAFYMCDNVNSIYYKGTVADWMLLAIGTNNFSQNIRVYPVGK